MIFRLLETKFGKRFFIFFIFGVLASYFMSGKFYFKHITIGIVAGIVGHYIIEGIKIYRD